MFPTMTPNTAAVRFFKVEDRCITILRYLFAFAIPLTIINISFSSIYAWIYSNQVRVVVPWPFTFVQATVPLLAKAWPNLHLCMASDAAIQYVYTSEDWQRCLVAPNNGVPGIIKDPRIPPPFNSDIRQDSQNFALAAATYAGRVFIFIILSFKMAYVGVRDTDVLPYALFTNVMSLASIIVYREAEPIQPTPNDLSATLITLTRYIKHDMYDGVLTPQICSKAYHLNKAFLACQYAVLALLTLVLCTVIFCLVSNARLGKVWEFKLKGNVAPLAIAVGAFAGYITCFIAKEKVAYDMMQVLIQKQLQYIFPFREGQMDIVSLTMMMTLGAVGVGTCKGDLEKFKLAAFVAYLHVALSYPSVLGTLHAYHSTQYPIINGKKLPSKAYHLWDVDNCMELVINKKPLFYGFDDEVRDVCKMFTVSMIGELIQFVFMHLNCIACIYILWANRDLGRQRLRLGSYAPDYGPVNVAVSIKEPLMGYQKKRKNGVGYSLLANNVIDGAGANSSPV